MDGHDLISQDFIGVHFDLIKVSSASTSPRIGSLWIEAGVVHSPFRHMVCCWRQDVSCTMCRHNIISSPHSMPILYWFGIVCLVLDDMGYYINLGPLYSLFLFLKSFLVNKEGFIYQWKCQIDGEGGALFTPALFLLNARKWNWK